MTESMDQEQFAKLLGKSPPSPPQHDRATSGKARVQRASRSPGKMNKLELQYAASLEILRQSGSIAAWSFEPVTLRLAPRTTYTPDFMVITGDSTIQFREVKGYWEDDARVKIKVAAEMFYWFDFYAITRKKGEWIYEKIG